MNGLTFVAEGVMVGTGSYTRLAVGQVPAAILAAQWGVLYSGNYRSVIHAVPSPDLSIYIFM